MERILMADRFMSAPTIHPAIPMSGYIREPRYQKERSPTGSFVKSGFRHIEVRAGKTVVGVPAQIGKAVLFCVGFEYPFLVRYGITLALQFILVGQSRIKGGNEVLGGLS